jgi:hypothetical protein
MKMFAAVLFLASTGCIYHRHPVEPMPNSPPLPRDEAQRLAAAGVSEPVLIELIEKRGAEPLSAEDIVALKNAGAGDAVIQKMIALKRDDPPPPVAVEDVYYYPTPVYVTYDYYPYYYRPYYYSSFGFGFGYSRHYGHRWSGLGVRIRR